MKFTKPVFTNCFCGKAVNVYYRTAKENCFFHSFSFTKGNMDQLTCDLLINWGLNEYVRSFAGNFFTSFYLTSNTRHIILCIVVKLKARDRRSYNIPKYIL